MERRNEKARGEDKPAEGDSAAGEAQNESSSLAENNN